MQLLGRASGGCLQRSKFSVSPRSALLPSSVSRHNRRQVLANDKKTTGNATIDSKCHLQLESASMFRRFGVRHSAQLVTTTDLSAAHLVSCMRMHSALCM
jgi:hypothetical protein